MSIRASILEILEKADLIGEKYISSVEIRSKIFKFELKLTCKEKFSEFEIYPPNKEHVIKADYLRWGRQSSSHLQMLIPEILSKNTELNKNLQHFSLLLDFWRFPCCLFMARKNLTWHYDNKEQWFMGSTIIDKCPNSKCRTFLPSILEGGYLDRFSVLAQKFS